MTRTITAWVLNGIRAGISAAVFSALILYAVLLLSFGHLFEGTPGYALALLFFLTNLSVLFGCVGLAAGLVWWVVHSAARRPVDLSNVPALCVATCLSVAGAFFAAAWVVFRLCPNRDTKTFLGLLVVFVAALISIWILSRAALRRIVLAFVPSIKGTVAVLVLSAVGTAIGARVHPEYLTRLPDHAMSPVAGVRWAGDADLASAVLSAKEGPTGPGVASAGRDTLDRGGRDIINVLLLTVDTLRADHLGCYGYARNTSPSADSLAASGTIFLKAYAQRPKTSPNFATILTSTYPQQHRVRRTRQALPDAAYTMAEMLRDLGYKTCGVVTNGNLFPAFGFDQGFDEYFFGHSDARSGTEIAIEWLSKNARMPFFLWVHHTDPHAPYRPPHPYDRLFEGGADNQAGAPGRRPLKITRSETLGGVFEDLLIDGPLDLAYYVSQYDGEIAYTDYWNGRLLSALRMLGLEGVTLVVFTADHGESLGEHDYYFEHGLFAYEPSARIPLILSLPGVIERGARDEGLVESVDFLPTVLELIGAQVPSSCQGRSVAGRAAPEFGRGLRWDGETLRPAAPGRGYAFVEAGYGHHSGPGYTFAVTDGRFKLIVRDSAWILRPRNVREFLYCLNALLEGGADSPELYDIAQDPGERVNLYGRRPAEEQLLGAELDAFLKKAREAGAVPRDAAERPLDEETVRALKALGYMR